LTANAGLFAAAAFAAGLAVAFTAVFAGVFAAVFTAVFAAALTTAFAAGFAAALTAMGLAAARAPALAAAFTAAAFAGADLVVLVALPGAVADFVLLEAGLAGAGTALARVDAAAAAPVAGTGFLVIGYSTA
jgi:hypothetical protein